MPKICVIVNNSNYFEILEILTLQNYPKELFDVYINEEIKSQYKFNVYKINNKKILENNYNLISIIDTSMDINYLNFISKDYLLGYDIIINNSSNISTLLLKRNLNMLFNNNIFDRNFSFHIKFLKENILNLNSNNLNYFLSSKTKLINYNHKSKTIKENNTLKLVNPLDKRLFYFILYTAINILLLFFIINKLFILLILIYLILIMDNIFFLYKINQIKLKTLLLSPFRLILNFRFNNKRSNI